MALNGSGERIFPLIFGSLRAPVPPLMNNKAHSKYSWRREERAKGKKEGEKKNKAGGTGAAIKHTYSRSNPNYGNAKRRNLKHAATRSKHILACAAPKGEKKNNPNLPGGDSGEL